MPGRDGTPCADNGWSRKCRGIEVRRSAHHIEVRPIEDDGVDTFDDVGTQGESGVAGAVDAAVGDADRPAAAVVVDARDRPAADDLTEHAVDVDRLPWPDRQLVDPRQLQEVREVTAPCLRDPTPRRTRPA